MENYSRNPQIGHGGSALLGLPAEVFLGINALVLGSEMKDSTESFLKPGSLRYYVELTSLRLVCHTWDQVLLTSPQFWIFLSSQHPPHAWDLILNRSHPLPLDAVLLPDCTDYYRDMFLGIISTHMNRIRSISCNFAKTAQNLNLSSVLSSPAPLLQNFVIDAPPLAWEFSLSGLFEGRSPMLTAVSITGNIVDEDCEVPALGNGRLEALVIDNQKRNLEMNPDLSSLRLARINFIPGLLRSSPKLRCLALRWCTLNGTWNSKPLLDGPRTFQLDTLKHLELSVTEPNLLEFIFANVDSPHCMDTKIVTWDSFPENLEHPIAHHIATTIRMANISHLLTLAFPAAGGVIVNNTIVYDIQGDMALEEVFTLGRIFSLLPADLLQRVGTVAISGPRWRSFSESFVLCILPLFRDLSELILQTSTYRLNLEALQGGLWTPEGTETDVLPCPRLRRIRLNSKKVSYDDAWALSNIIRLRNQFTVQHRLEDYIARVESVHLPPHGDPEAISAMFEGEGVAVEFASQPDIFQHLG